MSSTELAIALEDYRAQMSSSEARERLVAALVARAFSDEQLRRLSSATIVGRDGPIDLKDAIVNLTPQHIERTIQFMLEKNPSVIDPEFLKGFGGALHGIGSDGRGVPLRIESIERKFANEE